MRYYAVIDTNVLVSAMLKWNSVPGTVVQMICGTGKVQKRAKVIQKPI